MRQSRGRPRQPFLTEKGEPRLRAVLTPRGPIEYRPGQAIIDLRRFDDGSDSPAQIVERVGKLAGVELRTDETDAPQSDALPIPPRVFRPEGGPDRPAPTDRSRDRAGGGRAQHRVPDRFVHRRSDALLRLRRRPHALLRLRRRSHALLELEHGTPLHPPLVARRFSAAEQWAGQGDDRHPRHRDPGRRGQAAERRRVRGDRQSRPRSGGHQRRRLPRHRRRPHDIHPHDHPAGVAGRRRDGRRRHPQRR